MSFDYDQIKSSEDGGSHWATYSDLFMVLSLVFLLLYVVASLRTGTSNLQNQTKFQEIVRERDDLKQQIKVYNTLRDNYLQTGASSQEQKMYEELMNKLVLLKDEAKQEKNNLRKAATENEKKEQALNKYQQMIRNIINTNMVSSARIKRRNNTIVKNYKEIDGQKVEIKNLESTVSKKQKQVKKGRQAIKSLNSSLNKKVAQLKTSFKKNKISKKKMQIKIKQLQMSNDKKVKKLRQANAKASQEIQKNQMIIRQAEQKLDQAELKIASQEDSIQQLVAEKQEVTQKISSMRGAFHKKMKREKAAFNKKLAKQKLSAKAKAKKQKEFLHQAKAKETKLASQIQDMESEVQNVQGQLDQSRAEKSSLAAKSKALASKAKSLAGDKARLSSDLKRMRELANAKKKLIAEMKRNLAKSGIKAEIDAKSGDVVIQFGEEYFDTGKAQVKPGMEKVLRKFMPAYSKTLFSNKETAKRIKSIEIIGYASPTYKGKYVNPVSLEAGDKEAINYNLDLSYYRARSIFDYIFDTTKMKYQYQKDVLPKVKVTGRSFLAEGAEKRIISSMTNKEYCKKFDCKKSQRVVIKFNMEN